MDLVVDDSVGGLVEPDKIVVKPELDVPVDNIVIDDKPVVKNKSDFWIWFFFVLCVVVLTGFIVYCWFG